MRRIAATAVCVILALTIWAQNERHAPPPNLPTWEYRALVPIEISAGKYHQVDFFEVQSMGAQGWELISVTPWVIRNDEHKGSSEGMEKVVTQNYLGYFFKRPRPLQK